jgi:hypothetical protein
MAFISNESAVAKATSHRGELDMIEELSPLENAASLSANGASGGVEGFG